MSAAAVIVTTREELAAIVEAAVERVLESHGITAANTPPPLAVWLNTKEAAKLLDVHPRTVMNLAAPGPNGEPPRLPSSRIGRLLRFRRVDVEAFLEGQHG